MKRKMTSYSINLTIPELEDCTKLMFQIDWPDITVGGQVINETLVRKVFDDLSKINISGVKSALLGFLEGLI